jgi:hypothetical protein
MAYGKTWLRFSIGHIPFAGTAFIHQLPVPGAEMIFLFQISKYGLAPIN